MSLAPLDAIKISQLLSPTYPRVKVVAETTSTQSEITKVFSPLQPFDLLIAEHQTQGRGRLDRSFIAPSHRALLFSLFIEPSHEKKHWGVLPLIIGTSVAQALRDFTALPAVTKWPNDILIDNRKVCGILCEVQNNGVIAGIGINVNTPLDQLPVPTATSLAHELRSEVNREELLISVCHKISMNITLWNSGENVLREYENLSATIGSKVRITLSDGSQCEGTATGVSSDGELILDSGEKYSVGDVTHLR